MFRAHVSLSGKVVLCIFYRILHPYQDGRLPLIQLADLIVLEQFVRKLLLALSLDSLTQIRQKHVFSLRGKAGVHVAVLLERTIRGDHVSGGEMAYACSEEVVLDAVLHEVVVDGLLGDLFEVLDGFVVIAFHGGRIGNLEP